VAEDRAAAQGCRALRDEVEKLPLGPHSGEVEARQHEAGVGRVDVAVDEGGQQVGAV